MTILENVTKQFYLLSNFGLVILLLSVVVYHVQGIQGMFEKMRPFVVFTNLVTLIWFFAVQYYRFKETGRACCGDYLIEVPENAENIYIGTEGSWLVYFIFSHYLVYILQKGVSICITNRIATNYEKRILMV